MDGQFECGGKRVPIGSRPTSDLLRVYRIYQIILTATFDFKTFFDCYMSDGGWHLYYFIRLSALNTSWNWDRLGRELQ